MIREAIDRILEISAPHFHSEAGLHFTTKDLRPVRPPLAPPEPVSTLAGFVELLESNVDNIHDALGAYFIHIKSETEVQLTERTFDAYARRPVHVTAEPLKGVVHFPYFEKWGPQEEFLIGLQCHFQSSPDLDYLKTLCSHIDLKASVRTSDNGVTQEVTAQKSVAFKEQKEVRPRVFLKPFRTFREFEQPGSDFIFRIKEGVGFALFEADGGAWKLDAMGLIASWLRNRINTSTVTALQSLPIIS